MWRYSNGSPLKDDLVNIVEQLLLQEDISNQQLRICIGTDSQVRSLMTEYATVVVLLKKGAGGKMLVYKSKDKNRISIGERMLKEVAMSIETAIQLMPVVNKYGLQIEIHADINSDARFKSNVSFIAAKGYTLGMGFDFKAKPHAFASSCCANRMVH
jgi:predicted RNase H-related nuclease YkuK (DUF458 family)